jgi:RimJ/RimL family protein N-acetyltransferase
MDFQDLLEGDLRVGPFRKGDAAAFARAARESAASLSTWMPWCHPEYGEGEAHAWIALCAANLRDGLAWDMGIFSADRNTLIGGIGINQINRLHNYGNIGYWVRSSRQNRGIATRAARMIACFGFETLRLTRLEILAVEGNDASRRVALKAGAQFECMARNRLVLRGQARDAALHALLPQDLGITPAAA